MRKLLLPLAAASLSLTAHPLAAQTVPQLQTPPPVASELLQSSVRVAPTSLVTRAPPVIATLADDELSDLNGRQGSTTTILSDQDLTAINRGNSITAQTVTNGAITLGPGAFEGFAGVGNFVINSGNNNNLQGALTINIAGR